MNSVEQSKPVAWYSPTDSAAPFIKPHIKDAMLPEAAARYSIPLYTTYPASAFCEDCPPVGYPTDKTRCLPCPRRRGDHETIARAWQDLLDKDDRTSPEEYPDMALITFDEFKDALTQLRAPTAPQADQNAEKIRDYCTINWQLSTNNKIRIAKIYDNRQNEMLDADNAESCKHFYEALRKIAMGDPDAVAVAMEAVKMPWLWDQSVDVTVEELTEWIASENRRWDGAKSFARAFLDAFKVGRR